MGRILEQLKGQEEEKKRAGSTGKGQVGQGRDWQDREWKVKTRKKLTGQGQKKRVGWIGQGKKVQFQKNFFYALIKEGFQYMYMNIRYVYFMIFNV